MIVIGDHVLFRIELHEIPVLIEQIRDNVSVQEVLDAQLQLTLLVLLLQLDHVLVQIDPMKAVLDHMTTVLDQPVSAHVVTTMIMLFM